MKWYNGIKKRVLKKYAKANENGFKYIIFHDGACYTFNQWENLINKVAKLRSGDKVWNCYSQAWDIVKEIEFIVAPMKHFFSSRGIGKVIQEFTVITVTGYYLCDETMFDPDYWK